MFGGCILYTGAPYFAAISALKVGNVHNLQILSCTRPYFQSDVRYSGTVLVKPHLNNIANPVSVVGTKVLVLGETEASNVIKAYSIKLCTCVPMYCIDDPALQIWAT